jgi:hypothetical protein
LKALNLALVLIHDEEKILGEISIFLGSTTLAYCIDEIANSVCDSEARMKWVERMAEDILIAGNPDEGNG